MDTTTHHTMQDLFAQLGLPDSPAEIQGFVRRHRPLPDHLRLADAPFWTDSQASFLREQLRVDDDWAVQIDSLNALLREHPRADALPQASDAPADGASNEGEGNVSAARRDDAAAQAHVRQHDTAQLARDAAPRSEAEARALQAAERAGTAKARG